MTLAPPHNPRTRRLPQLLPGLGLAAGATVVLLVGSRALSAAGVSVVSPLVLALILGAVVGSVLGRTATRPGAARFSRRIAPGTDLVARTVLRAGVVLLGLQLSVPDVLALGWRGVAVVLVTVSVTFTATLAIGRRMHVPRETALLVATGFSICGAAAVSAMTGVLERTPRTGASGGPEASNGRTALRDDVAAALALVTVYGTVAVLVLPWLAGLLGLSDHQAGLWFGASIQEVAQVVAAAGTVSATALATATVAKLARVVLLAPLVAGASVALSRRSSLAEPGTTDAPRRPAPPVPGFVLGFLAAVVVRSLGVLPDDVLAATSQVTTVLFVAAMFALGLGVDVPRLARTGRRPLALGAVAAVVVTGTSLAAVLLLHP